MIHPSGGWGYHLKAFCFAPFLWRNHRKNIAQVVSRFVRNNQLQGKVLVMVGASAGHELTCVDFSVFKKIIVFEPDGVAKILFRLRYGRWWPYVEWHRTAVVTGNESVFLGGDAVLWCNVLGQDSVSGKGFPLSAIGADPRPQCSFHDAVSGAESRGVMVEGRWASSATGAGFTRILLKDRRDGRREAISHWSGERNVTLVDHDTLNVFPDVTDARFWAWRLTPWSTHWVEAVTRPQE